MAKKKKVFVPSEFAILWKSRYEKKFADDAMIKMLLDKQLVTKEEYDWIIDTKV